MAYPFSFSDSDSSGRAGADREAAWRPRGRRWRSGLRSVLCAVVVAVASGCETIAPEVQDTAIVTAGSSFELKKEIALGHTWYFAKIPYTYTNRTGSKVYIDPGCGGRHHDVEMYEGGEDGSGGWGPVRVSDCMSHRGFLPHGRAGRGLPGYPTHRGLHRTSAGRELRSAPDSAVRFTQFRVVWFAWSSLDEDRYGYPIPGDLLPLEERVSNHFTLEVVE